MDRVVGRVEVVVLRGAVELARWALPVPADLDLVDGLARLQLAARRRGWRVVVRGGVGDVAGLLALAGLAGVVPCEARPGGSAQVGGEPECGEEPGVEEVVVPDDPLA